MASIGQVRGALLEESVLHLLGKVGYKIIREIRDSIDPSDLRMNRAGMEVQGRGAWHQIDGLVEQYHTPAFLYPLRLLVEAKCYPSDPVGIGVVRNALGVQKDIEENYFTKHLEPSDTSSIRFNYQSAIFSSSSYTKPAMEYALAHQIFLIEYKSIPIIQPLIEAINSCELSHFTAGQQVNLRRLREDFHDLINGTLQVDVAQTISIDGREHIRGAINGLQQIRGSYFGMLQGRWPMHLLTENELTSEQFSQDTIRCELHGDRDGWTFSPSGLGRNDPRWFELQFHLPPQLVFKMESQWGDRRRVAQTKSENFSSISLSGKIGGIWRNVRLELDEDWLRRYLLSTAF
ncbi:TPA: hypothetical protein ACMD0P_004546 [Vibrio parahaemolyticus]|nr:hypothetical protein [Vibrio parahaemolyticus]EJL6392773.1 hypothetical protein [Vibrio vulnificus]